MAQITGSSSLAPELDTLREIKVTLDALVTAFNLHTHNYNGAAAGVEASSKAQSNTAVPAIGTAVIVPALNLTS